MAKRPILPARPADPTGGNQMELAAMRALRAKVKESAKIFAAVASDLPSGEIVANAKYEYRISGNLLSDLMEAAAAAVDRIFLEGGRDNVWFFSAHVGPAYERGTHASFINLARQSDAYKADNARFVDILSSEPFLRRIGLVALRQYEEMDDLSATIKTDMGRILTEGIGRGKSPRSIAAELMAKVPLEEFRANRIARTEITTALRRGRWDEHDEAVEKYDFLAMLMHFSAMSPTTRATHAARHGNLYTSDEIRDWYSEDGNAINCKCTQISVLVDAQGKPLVPQVVERARAIKREMERDHKGPWSKKDDA